jgi:hypothetical protein
VTRLRERLEESPPWGFLDGQVVVGLGNLFSLALAELPGPQTYRGTELELLGAIERRLDAAFTQARVVGDGVVVISGRRFSIHGVFAGKQADYTVAAEELQRLVRRWTLLRTRTPWPVSRLMPPPHTYHSYGLPIALGLRQPGLAALAEACGVVEEDLLTAIPESSREIVARFRRISVKNFLIIANRFHLENATDYIVDVNRNDRVPDDLEDFLRAVHAAAFMMADIDDTATDAGEHLGAELEALDRGYLEFDLDRSRVRVAAESLWLKAQQHHHRIVIGSDVSIGRKPGGFTATPVLRLTITNDAKLGVNAV